METLKGSIRSTASYLPNGSILGDFVHIDVAQQMTMHPDIILSKSLCLPMIHGFFHTEDFYGPGW